MFLFTYLQKTMFLSMFRIAEKAQKALMARPWWEDAGGAGAGSIKTV